MQQCLKDNDYPSQGRVQAGISTLCRWCFHHHHWWQWRQRRRRRPQQQQQQASHWDRFPPLLSKVVEWTLLRLHKLCICHLDLDMACFPTSPRWRTKDHNAWWIERGSPLFSEDTGWWSMIKFTQRFFFWAYLRYTLSTGKLKWHIVIWYGWKLHGTSKSGISFPKYITLEPSWSLVGWWDEILSSIMGFHGQSVWFPHKIVW